MYHALKVTIFFWKIIYYWLFPIKEKY